MTKQRTSYVEETTEGEHPEGVGAHGRAYERQEVCLRVSYPRMNAFFFEYTRNLSQGGMFVETKTPFDVGTRLAFELVVPGFNEAVILRGDVRWIRRPDEANEEAPGMGVAFVFEGDNEREDLQRQVRELMRKSLGLGIARALTTD